MSKSYIHINQEERELIAQMRWEGNSLSEIARVLYRDKGTISRELKRNASPKYECYTPCQAQRRADRKRIESYDRPRLKQELIRRYVHEKIMVDWSPELIAGRLKIDHPGYEISHEAIYQYIYHPQTPQRQEMIARLIRGHRKRRPKDIGRKERKTKIPNRIPIDARPESVELRQQYGHWEGDSIVSRKSKAALNSLTERKSRLLLLTKIDRKSASETNKAVLKRLQKLPLKARRTLTLDNGTENAKHEKLTRKLGIQCYFAHPYSSWERGTNEHINGMVRWYLPKGTDFSKIDKKQLAKIESCINSRPRKCLGFKTPLEVAASFVALQS